MTKVNIQLTDEQKQQVRNQSGVEVDALTFETLEDRDAPKVGKAKGAHAVFPQINNPSVSNDLPIFDDPNAT